MANPKNISVVESVEAFQKWCMS